MTENPYEAPREPDGTLLHKRDTEFPIGAVLFVGGLLTAIILFLVAAEGALASSSSVAGRARIAFIHRALNLGMLLGLTAMVAGAIRRITGGR